MWGIVGIGSVRIYYANCGQFFPLGNVISSWIVNDTCHNNVTTNAKWKDFFKSVKGNEKF